MNSKPIWITAKTKEGKIVQVPMNRAARKSLQKSRGSVTITTPPLKPFHIRKPDKSGEAM